MVVEEVMTGFPGARLVFRSWLTGSFIADAQSSIPEDAGVRAAIKGSLGTILITILFAFPVGVGAAIYLEEYARDSRLNRVIQTNINNLSGVPSIIYGMLGLTVFVRAMEPVTSGALFGVGDSSGNGRTILSAGLTLGLLILPVIIINAQEAIKAVPDSLRQSSYGLGATKWQTIRHHVLPSSLDRILTGTILATSRAIGETAPMVVVGASTLVTLDPTGPFSKFTTLPIQIYQWTARPQAEFRNAAAAAILAALEMKNVVVGPTIQTENPGIIFFIYIGLIIANFLMYFMAIALIKPCVKLFSLPRTLLMPLIIPICVMGAFAVSLNYFDVYLMFIAGIVGYVLHRFGFPLAPMVLAVILGPLADENLRRALLVFEDNSVWWIISERPIGSILIVIVLYTFYDGIFRRGKPA